jgi:hypothetical protein
VPCCIQPVLQNNSCCNRVNTVPVSSRRFALYFFCGMRAEVFVHPVYRDLETRLELTGKTSGRPGGFGVAAIRVQRQTNNQGIGRPFGYQTADSAPVRFSIVAVKRAQCRCGTGDVLTYGNPDTMASIVKSEQGLQACATGLRYPSCSCPGYLQAWPMSPDNRLRSTPSSAAAASQRCSQGVLNTISVLAGPLSQALAAISCSS